MTPADQHALREALARVIRNSIRGKMGIDHSLIQALVSGPEQVADALIAGPLAPYLAAEAERDAIGKRDAHEFALRSEAPGDPWEMVRHLEEQCRLFIRERDEWKAVADRDRAARLAAEAERDAAIRERLPHMCRDDHPEIRHAVSDDDERCPVCRERDRALAAETDMKAAEAHADALNEKLVALAPHGTCACSHDRPGDVCSHHSPALRAAEAENTRLKETVEAAATRFEDIAAGRAFQPRLHAATGATEARAVLATLAPKESADV